MLFNNFDNQLFFFFDTYRINFLISFELKLELRNLQLVEYIGIFDSLTSLRIVIFVTNDLYIVDYKFIIKLRTIPASSRTAVHPKL